MINTKLIVKSKKTLSGGVGSAVVQNITVSASERAKYADTAGYAEKAGEAQTALSAEYAKNLSPETAAQFDEKYLSRLNDDTAKGLITFLAGLKSDSIESQKFLAGVNGFGGYGFRLGMDEQNNSHLQVDFLEVMKKAIFAELEVRKRTSIGGNLLLSGAASTLTKVVPIWEDGYEGYPEEEEDTEGEGSGEGASAGAVSHGAIVAYKCYIKTDDSTMQTQNNWQEGMQAICQTFDVKEGVYKDVENQYYWRVVTYAEERQPIYTIDPETNLSVQAVDERGELMWEEAYVILSNDVAYMDKLCSAPKAGDVIVHCGFNKLYYVTEMEPDDKELKYFPVNLTGVMCLDSNAVSASAIQIATSIRMYDLVTDFSFESATLTFGAARDGVRINSASFKWTSAIGELTPVIHFGAYEDWDFSKGNIPYFYEVEYGGFNWICTAKDGAPEGELPYEGSKYWKAQKTKGVTYDAYLEHNSDNITVDADGNVVEGLWEETRTEDGSVVANVYKLHTAIFAQKNEEYLVLDFVNYGLWTSINFAKIGGLPFHSLIEYNDKHYRWNNANDATAADVPGTSAGWVEYNISTPATGHYNIEISPSDCYAIIKEGMVQVMAIENVKDGVNNSGDDDWSDEQWETMRAMRRCDVNLTVQMEGSVTRMLTYAINIDHVPTQTITSDIDNQAGALSWSASQGKYINTLGGIIRSSYKNAPISPYLATDDPKTPDFDESKYNPYVEFVNEAGAAVSYFNGTLSLVNLDESGVAYKGLKLEVTPKTANTNSIPDGRYTAKVHFVVKVAGIYYEKVITHDILKDSKGVTFELNPSVSQIRATYNAAGSLVPSVSAIGCSIIISDAEGSRETTAADWTAYKLAMKCNGSNVAFGALVSVSAEVRDYEFVLYQDGVATGEKETVPVIADGKVGEDGGDTEYIYTRTLNKGTRPSLPTFTGSAATSRITDSATDTAGVVWTNHPQGTTTALACEWQCMRNSTTDANTKKRVWSNNWTNLIEWQRDGDGLEYIYIYKKTEGAPATALTNAATTDGHVPATAAASGESGWLDEPNSTKSGWTAINGCNSTWRYLWQSTRKKDAGGNWGNFTTPILRDHYAYDGVSLTIDKQSVTIPCTSAGYPKSATTYTVTAKLNCGKETPTIAVAESGWTINQSAKTATYSYTTSTSSVFSNFDKTITVTATFSDGTTQTLSGKVSFVASLDGQTSFKSTVFKRAASQPTAPSGGDYSNSVPSGWSDGIPAEDGNPCWMSTRIFTSDGKSPQQDAWTTPVKIADTADLDVCFSAYTNCYTAQLPAPGSNTENTYWHNVGTEDDIWMATSTCSNGVWSSWSVNKIKGEKGDKGEEGQSTFKSTVFKRAASQPTAPSGGSYGSPVPSGWSDGIPAEDGKPCWMSTRIFTDDGNAPQQSSWTTPVKCADTSDIDFEWSSVASSPGTPTSNPSNWHNTATSADIWMAVRKMSNGAWSSWEVSKIKGEDGSSVRTVDETQYYTTSSASTPSASAGWSSSFPTDWNDTYPYCHQRKRTLTYTDGTLTDTSAWSYSLYGYLGTKGDAGANSHAVTFSPATLNFETNDYGTVTGDLSVYVEPIVENGVVSSIILGTPVHCTAGRDSSYKKFCISAIAYEKGYDSSGNSVASSAISSAAYKIPYATGYVPVTVNFTDITTGKSDSKTVNYDWTVNLAVFMGVVFSDNKSYYSKFTAWTNGYTSASQVFQDAKTWVAEQSYTNENSIRTIYAGIGVGNGKIVGMSNNFALYKPIDGVTVKDIVNNSNNTYDKYRTLYWDGSAWRFTGKIYAEAGEFRGKVTATEGDIGCLHIDGSDYLSVKDSSGNDSVVISQKTIPSYVTPFSNQALAFNYASTEENEVKTYSVPCNVTAEGGETTAYSARFYAPIAKRDALSYVGVTLAATCKIASFTRKTDNVYGNTRVIMLYLVAKDSSGNVKYQTSPNVITTQSSYLSSYTSYSVYYTVFDTSLYYYLKVVTLGAQETTVSVTATASYTQGKVLNFLGKDGVLFGYSATKNVRIKNGEMFINGYPALALIAFFKVSAAASVTTKYKATGVTITASLTTKNDRSCFYVTATGLTAGSRPMVFLDGLHLLDGSTNRYTKATLVESSFSSGTLSFYVYTSEDSGQRNLPFECKILDISTVQTYV